MSDQLDAVLNVLLLQVVDRGASHLVGEEADRRQLPLELLNCIRWEGVQTGKDIDSDSITRNSSFSPSEECRSPPLTILTLPIRGPK